MKEETSAFFYRGVLFNSFVLGYNNEKYEEVVYGR